MLRTPRADGMTKPVNAPIQMGGSFPLTTEALVGRSWGEVLTHDPTPSIRLWETVLSFPNSSPVGIVEGPATRHASESAAHEMARIAYRHTHCHISVLDLEEVTSVPHAIVGLARKIPVQGFPLGGHVVFPLVSAAQNFNVAPADLQRAEALLSQPDLELLQVLLYAGIQKAQMSRWLIVLLNADGVSDSDSLRRALQALMGVIFVFDVVPSPRWFERSVVRVPVRDLLRNIGAEPLALARASQPSTDPLALERDRLLLKCGALSKQVRQLEAARALREKDVLEITAARDAALDQLRILQGKMVR